MKLNEYLQANLIESTVDLHNLSNIETYLNDCDFEYIDADERGIEYDADDLMIFDTIMDDDYWNYTKKEYRGVIVYFMTIGCNRFYLFKYKKNTRKLEKALSFFNDEVEGFNPQVELNNVNLVLKDFIDSTGR